MHDLVSGLPTWAQFIIAVLLLFGGGAAAKLIDYLKFQYDENRQESAKRREEKRLDLTAIISQLKTDKEELKSEVRALRDEVTSLTARIAHLEALATSEIPVPMWSTDRDGVYQWVNSTYRDVILDPIGMTESDLIGRTHEEVWGPEFNAMIQASHRRAMESARNRAIIHGVKLPRVQGAWTIHKFPLMRGAVVAGWRGMAIASGDAVTFNELMEGKA